MLGIGDPSHIYLVKYKSEHGTMWIENVWVVDQMDKKFPENVKNANDMVVSLVIHCFHSDWNLWKILVWYSHGSSKLIRGAVWTWIVLLVSLNSQYLNSNKTEKRNVIKEKLLDTVACYFHSFPQKHRMGCLSKFYLDPIDIVLIIPNTPTNFFEWCNTSVQKFFEVLLHSEIFCFCFIWTHYNNIDWIQVKF